MLIKITNKCSMGCGHCMEDSTVAGAHMDAVTFAAALDFTERVERAAYQAGCPRLVLLSGGECTEHPDFSAMLDETLARDFQVLLITNGMWLADEALRGDILRPERKGLLVQVVNDPRFYPKAPPRWEDPRITYADHVPMLISLGRAARRRPKSNDPPARKYPASYNLRALVREGRSFVAAIQFLRALGKECAPAVNDDGSVVAGETRSCWKIGSVRSADEELTEGVLRMGSCDRCGLERNLSQAQRRAAGISALYLGTEG